MFENIFFVKGYNRILVCDIQREKINLLPLDVYDIVLDLKKKISVKNIIKKYGDINKVVINEYIQFFLDNEYGFYCNSEEFDLFPQINTEFNKPAQITNSIIELNDYNSILINKIKLELENLNCTSTSIIIYNKISNESILELLELFDGSRIKSFELTIKYDINIVDSFFQRIKTKTNNRLTRLTIFNSPFNKFIQYNNYLFEIYYAKSNIKSFYTCGKIDTEYFQLNQDKFFESLNFNSCLYKKISVNKEGLIKNCPAFSQSFGNINEITLKDALQHPNFKEFWYIKKDDIEICKDCEFRHVCTDCRAFIEDPENIYSKPLKCGYNPYTCEWEEWSTNPLKQKAIEYYGLQELIKKDV